MYWSKHWTHTRRKDVSFLVVPYRIDDCFNDRWISQRRRIAQAAPLSTQDLPQNPSHDFSRPCFRQIINDEYSLGRRKWSYLLPNLQNELLPYVIICTFVLPTLQRNECIYRLACHFVVNAHNCGFYDLFVLDQSSFDLGRGQTMA